MSYPGSVRLHGILQSSFLAGIANHFAVIGLIGIFYAGWGRAAAWSLFFVSLAYLPSLAIDWRLFRNSALLIVALAVGALFSANPEASLSGCWKITLGLCMFVPGVLWGWHLRRGQFSIVVLVFIFVFGLLHFVFPVVYGGNLVFGFHENLNIVGRGLTFILLLLAIAASPLSFQESWNVDRRRKLYSILLCVNILFFGALLVIANYRAGWLAFCSYFFMAILGSERLSRQSKITFSSCVFGFFAALVIFLDRKGLGNGSLEERLNMWTRALDGWLRHHLVFGSGFQSFDLMHHLYYFSGVTRVFRYPHNIFVEFVFSAGLYGVLVLAIFLLVQIRFFGSSGVLFGEPTSKACLAAIIALLVAGQFGMELASFSYIGGLAAFAGVLYAQRPDTAVLRVSNPVQKVSD